MNNAFTVTTSTHGLPCVEVQNDQEKAAFLRQRVLDNDARSSSYLARVGSGAFLQGYDAQRGWALVEFWQSNYGAFVGHLNSTYRPEE